jgi:hypothetical protein
MSNFIAFSLNPRFLRLLLFLVESLVVRVVLGRHVLLSKLLRRLSKLAWLWLYLHWRLLLHYLIGRQRSKDVHIYVGLRCIASWGLLESLWRRHVHVWLHHVVWVNVRVNITRLIIH